MKSCLLYTSSCDDNGLNIKQALDNNTSAMPGEDYVEYDASAGSVTTAVDKDNNTAGSGTLFTLTQTMSKDCLLYTSRCV